ncbi:MAG: hypothetical protein K0S08_2166 [Gammaproteobacteria bacterium]|jgi:hypothetical protein|nr:hypothetical protein [Gammaproteobacteria bacterium]
MPHSNNTNSSEEIIMPTSKLTRFFRTAAITSALESAIGNLLHQAKPQNSWGNIFAAMAVGGSLFGRVFSGVLHRNDDDVAPETAGRYIAVLLPVVLVTFVERSTELEPCVAFNLITALTAATEAALAYISERHDRNQASAQVARPQ